MEHLKKRLNQLLEKKIELDNYLANYPSLFYKRQFKESLCLK